MRLITSIFFALILLCLTSFSVNKVISSERNLPCCNNIDPQNNFAPKWSFKCVGEQQQDIEISRNCCLEKWWMYGPFSSPNTPCACQGEEGHD